MRLWCIALLRGPAHSARRSRTARACLTEQLHVQGFGGYAPRRDGKSPLQGNLTRTVPTSLAQSLLSGSSGMQVTSSHYMLV